MPHTTSSEMQIGTNQLYHLGPFACSRETTKPDMEDVPYRVLLESLSWTQARAGAFLGVSRQTSNAFATGRRAAPPAALKLLRVVLCCSLTMSREHYNRPVQACDLPDIEAGA
jgi:DNA-binding XRE family transcriptional regulator